MEIAALNQRIVIEKSAVETDANGNHTNSWVAYHTCYATISDSTGKSNTEESVAGQILDTSDVSFTVRYCNAVLDVTTTGFRVLWNGDLYNIQKIDHLKMRKNAIKFRCVKERR